jgi:NADH-quinone oxidoreductase subunit G
MVKIRIDDRELEVQEGTTIFQAATDAGIPIPHFCYHPAFAPEGTCRMCMVEIEGVPKLEMACATVVREGMVVSTQSERVREGRRGVLEFLLAEHPLDCPICDQAGDCKLQDYFEDYGLTENHFREVKDKHEKKVSLGKTLIHDQERCILCRRCVRFLSEITGTEDMGVFERGGHTEVNIYLDNLVDNNYSGNLAQLCPVGAITDKDFRFQTRSWFLNDSESICPLCSRGCRILIGHHPGFSRFTLPKRVYRIKAQHNEAVNGYWICDRGRYGYSYLDENRATKLNARESQSRLKWEAALTLLTEKLKRLYYMKKTSRITLILNTTLSNEELYLVRKLFKDDLTDVNIFFAEPEAGTGDELLLTAERTPNRKGAEGLGFDLKPVDMDILSSGTDLLVIFGTYVLEGHTLSDLASALEKISAKFVITPHTSELDPLVDLVLPSTHIAEKAGSLTNTDGLVQHFRPALDPLGESRPEWKILVDLGKELAINFKFYGQFSNPSDISRILEKEIPLFGK